MLARMTHIPSAVFLALVAMTIGQRLQELLRSRSNQATLRMQGFERVDSHRSYSYMVAVHTTWFVAMFVEHVFGPASLPPIVSWIALAVFVVAQLLRFWVFQTLGSQWNVQVMTPGAAEDGLGLVTVGPYRYVRHPNYLAVILEFLALPLVGDAPLTAIVWSCSNGVVLFFRIRYEERHLKRRPGYDEHLAKIPCLVPRLWAR